MIVKRTSRELPVSCGQLLGLEVIAIGTTGLPSVQTLVPGELLTGKTESQPSALVPLALACNGALLTAGVAVFVGSKIGQPAD